MLKKTSPVKPEESPVKEESPDKMDSSVRAESPLVTELVKSQVNNLKILYGNILKENFLFPPPKKKTIYVAGTNLSSINCSVHNLRFWF